MGGKQSINERRYNAVPPPQMSQAQVQSLLEAQRQQYERKLEEVAAREAAQRRQDEAAKAAAQRRQEEAAKAAAQRRQEEAAKAAAQRRQEEVAKAAALRKQQEEAAKAAQNMPQMSQAQVQSLLEAQRQQYEGKLEEVAAREAAQRRQEEAAKAAAQRRQDEAAKAAAQRRQEEAAKAAAQRRQEEVAKAAALWKQQEEAAKAAQNIIERDRTPYSYSTNQLQQAAASQMNPTFIPVYPNLNQGPKNPNNGQHQYHVPCRSQDDAFVFVNNLGQTQSYNNRPAPTAPAPRRGPSPRARSISRNRNAPKERDVLDCPTCHTRFGMKIFQCDSGHSSCNDCKSRCRTCGICRKTLTNRRNYDLENHVAQTKAPCPHTSEGCKLNIKIADMENHVRECPFKEQDCPHAAVFGTCRWKGKLSEISNHFDNMHPNGHQTNVDSEMQLTNVRNNSQQVHLTVLGVYNFLLHVKVSETDGKVYMAVQLIGTKFGAQKWLYEIHVYNKSQNRRKYMYTENCCSSNDKIEDVFKAGECAVLPVWHANTFVCNGALTYKFFIKKADEEKRVFGKNQRGRGRGRNH